MAKRGKSPRAQVPLRIPEATRARIEKAAKTRGVSMNAEIVERLERSFETEDRLGGPRVVDLIEAIATVMRAAGEQSAYYETSKSMGAGEWLTMPFPYDQARKAVTEILKRFAPPGKIVIPERTVDDLAKQGWKGISREDAKFMSRFHAQLGRLIAHTEHDRVVAASGPDKKEPKK